MKVHVSSICTCMCMYTRLYESFPIVHTPETSSSLLYYDSMQNVRVRNKVWLLYGCNGQPLAIIEWPFFLTITIFLCSSQYACHSLLENNANRELISSHYTSSVLAFQYYMHVIPVTWYYLVLNVSWVTQFFLLPPLLLRFTLMYTSQESGKVVSPPTFHMRILEHSLVIAKMLYASLYEAAVWHTRRRN